VGGRGTIIRTTNGGTSWTPEVSGVDTILRDVYFTEPTRGWAVGMGGTIIHTGPSGPDDPGATFSVITGWNLVSVPVAVEDYSVGAVFPLASGNAHGYDDGYVSTETLEGGRGYWLKFASGGTISVLGDPVAAETVAVNEEWNMVGSVSSAVDVTSIGSEPPGIVTSAFYYFDGAYQQSTVIEPGRGYWVKASQAGELIMGPAGAVPSSSRIRIEDKGERPPGPPGGDVGAGGPGETPVSFYLAQNSPNPFNSSTTIRFAVPARGRVSLTVYDVLGRPAATLVDGELSPGEHEVRWEAGDLPSGVYLCRIEAGSDMAVTKVLLLK
jgi:hypothetical protein